MRFSFLPLLPAFSALRLPDLLTPQSALQAADAFVHSSSDLSYVSGMKLASIPRDDTL